MNIRPITPEDKDAYNAVVTHPLQSYEWGEFRKQTGIKVLRRGIFDGDKLIAGFTLTIHKIPHTPWTIGYLPKGALPDKELITALKQIGKEENCVFIQLEPNILMNQESRIKNQGERWKMEDGKWKIVPAAHPLFTRYTFMLDLTKSEDELLANMHPKTRYNIKVAKKHGVVVREDNSEKAFHRYWELTEETTKRQNFYAHTKRYHELQWETFTSQNPKLETRNSKYTQNMNNSSEDSNFTLSGTSGFRYSDLNRLTYHLFTATYQKKILTTMVFFVFHDALYYPYGASSNEHRNVMHSTLTMWEAIRFGKKLGLKKFDMWGAMGPEPDPNDPWFGFHDFKRKFGPEHIEFIGSYDLVINPVLYQGYKLADKLRWMLLKKKNKE
jgi:lipid II:glycine glycyltransferase (peptidoglycan interpeptide bridge formation enzyme)